MHRLTILALALIAASCSQSDAAKPRIGLVPRSADDAVGAVIRKSIEASAQGKAELAVADSQDRQSVQNAQAGSLFDKELESIAIDPVDESFLDPIIKQAKAKRVPVVFFGLEPPRKSMRSWDKLFFVGTRREDVGTAQGELLASSWKANPAADRDKDGVLQYVALTAAGEEQESARQAEAASKALDAAGIPNVMLAQEFVEGGVEAARKKTAALIAVHGERIEAFLCRDDDMALGAASALRAAGYSKAKRHTLVVGASVGGGSGELSAKVAAAIESGALVGTAFPDPAAQGKAIFDLSYALARGTAPWRAGWRITDAKYVWVPCKKIAKADLPPKP
jgi:methyl-galactoside transport system substrate-binding protein